MRILSAKIAVHPLISDFKQSWPDIRLGIGSDSTIQLFLGDGEDLFVYLDFFCRGQSVFCSRASVCGHFYEVGLAWDIVNFHSRRPDGMSKKLSSVE